MVKGYLMPFRHYFGFPLIESGRYVPQRPMSLTSIPSNVVCGEAGIE